MQHRPFKLNKLISAILIVVLLCLTSPLLSSQAPQLQIFEEAWQTVNENFYDPNFNGVDWQAVRKKYQPQAAQAQSTQAVAVVINQMLSELQTSHTHFYTQAEPAYYQLLGIFKPFSDFQEELKKVFPDRNINYTGIGVFTQETNGKIFVSAILDGSPAAEAGLRVGDQLLEVNGKPYQPIQSFVDTNQDVKLLIQPTADPNSRKTIQVTPQEFEPTQMFLDAQQASAAVIERKGKKIGYIHIWSRVGAEDEDLQQLEEELTYGKLKDADGLILDLRNGWGGVSTRYLHLFTGESPDIMSVGREGQPNRVDYDWNKPVVALVNEGTRSAKEILAFGFQNYNIGSVIGSKTAGAVVGGRPFLLSDGSLLYVAVVDVYVDGERLEGQGVTPDISVPFSLEYAEGDDPQKEQAIETVLETINQEKRLPDILD